MRKGKQLIAMICILVLIVSAMAVTASAENNHHDAFFEFDVLSNIPYGIEPRYKTDTTPLYVNVQTGSERAIYVRAEGVTSNYSKFENLTCVNGTLVDHVTCSIGIGSAYKYSIHSWIYEHGYSMATLSFISTVGYGHITGVWSPDSQGTYNYAT